MLLGAIKEDEEMANDFKSYLVRNNLSKNTIASYLFAVAQFSKKYKKITKENLLAYKGFLTETYKPKTVNLRIQGINKYLSFLSQDDLQLKAVKIQQKNFLENVISDPDYEFFKKSLKKDNNIPWYFLIRFLGATGARISELLQFKAEHVFVGYFDIYSKGGKVRRIYIPKTLQQEALIWMSSFSKTSGYLFLNKEGQRITSRGVSVQLKKLAAKYGIDPKVVYPHSFRHRFAKNFLGKYNDIALLADLMGHDSIETTRIYLRRTSTEQKEIVDKIVVW
jgi:site-specific recombinase XerD